LKNAKDDIQRTHHCHGKIYEQKVDAWQFEEHAKYHAKQVDE
jgi:hypothetical protein